jgi:predicted nucleotidyltransferase
VIEKPTQLGCWGGFCYFAAMIREDAIAKLQTFEPRLRALGATALFLFGSTARGEATAASDLDLIIDLEPQSRFTLLDLAAAQRFLAAGIGVPIDLTTRDSLHPRLRDGILLEAKQVF